MLIMAHVFLDQVSEVPLAKENEVVETFVLDRLDEALSVRIAVRTLRRDLNCLYIDTFEGRSERLREEWIAVVDEKPCTAQKFVVRIGGVSCEWSPSGHSARH